MTIPVKEVDDRIILAGAAIAVTVVASDAIVDGGAATPVVDVTGRSGYVQPVNTPIRVVSTDRALVTAGAATPVWVVSGNLGLFDLLTESGSDLTTESGNALRTE